MKDVKEITIRSNYVSGAIEIMVISIVISGIFLIFSESFLLAILVFFFTAIVDFLRINKRWFKTLYIRENSEGIKTVYDFKRFGKKEKLVKYASMISATYYYDTYNTPTQFFIKLKYEEFSFECSMEEAKIIKNILLKKGIKTTLHSVLEGTKS